MGLRKCVMNERGKMIRQVISGNKEVCNGARERGGENETIRKGERDRERLNEKDCEWERKTEL